jgi:hypothetical protein
MMRLLDAQLRIALLSHVVACMSRGQRELLPGIGDDECSRLTGLSVSDLSRLASMGTLAVTVGIEPEGLKASLRTLASVREAKELEAYFIRHGATWQMMRAFFKVRRKETLRRRRDCGARRSAGRSALPDTATRERVYRLWLSMEQRHHPRLRYYHLHQAFPRLAIAVLERIVADFEADR